MEEQRAEAGFQAGAVGQHVRVGVVVRVGMAWVHMMAVEIVHVRVVTGTTLRVQTIGPGVREARCGGEAELWEAVPTPDACWVCRVKGSSSGEVRVHCGEAGCRLGGVATAPQGGG